MELNKISKLNEVKNITNDKDIYDKLSNINNYHFMEDATFKIFSKKDCTVQLNMVFLNNI